MKHGTVVGFRINKCRCDECVKAIRKYDKGRRIDEARGIKRIVPSTLARQHVEALVAAGMSRRTIASAAGYKDGTGLNVILNREKIRLTTEKKILAVKTHAGRTHKGWVPAIGATRRMQALAWMGWPMKTVVEKIGINPDTASDLRNGKTRNITEALYELVAAFYDEHHMTHGGDRRSHLHAVRKGWQPPLAWDDIDNPDEEPKR